MTDDIMDLGDDKKADNVAGDNTDVIELTDIVTDPVDLPETNDIIELTDILEPGDTGPGSSETGPDEKEIDVEGKIDIEDGLTEDGLTEDGLTLEAPADPDDDPVLDMKAFEEPEPPTDEGVNQALKTDITPEQVEAALERVIERKFSDKIGSILFEVMEKVIEKELKSIKESLQKDLDQIGSG